MSSIDRLQSILILIIQKSTGWCRINRYHFTHVVFEQSTIKEIGNWYRLRGEEMGLHVEANVK
jgi:hypothetical protein